MKYEGRPLSGPTSSPTFSLVTRVLGPTFPGGCHSRKAVYMLQYPGVCALFPLNSRLSGAQKDLPIEKLQQADPIAGRFFIHTGKSCTERLQLPELDRRSLYFEPVVVRINTGIRFAKRKRSLLFRRHTLQHVMSILGTPDQIFVKDVDSMRIHRNGMQDGKLPSTQGDYFLNYFRLGIDVLISGPTHTLKKIILHTNMPATRNFNRYNRCNYQIMVKTGQKQGSSGVGVSDSVAGDSKTNAHSSSSSNNNNNNNTQSAAVTDETEANNKTSASKPRLISFNTRWDEIQQILGAGGRPMVYGGAPGLLDYPNPVHEDGDAKSAGDKSPSGPMILGGASELNRLNPFKSTFFYAYDGIIFEVLPNSYIASVILFAS
eukprot:CAMPEP_0197519434 /NCGR_PEP_ID=MMETSP1318-20131121/4700_1 /TAXON_ID=552666 /ORGANISM="Partenskyella glossopodia, Strain RCC365" /LENGTH=374 /DNA_ID=CAMNT_0043070405 /DNA_START=73 /DNA_END=1197 /DNA_ORIENTATION=-